MKQRLSGMLLIALFSLTLSLHAQNEIELVESTPVGTVLDNADIRNADRVWIEMINRARKTLDIEQFYISTKPGEPMDPVINAVLKAAARGVRVRVLADAKMHKTYPGTVDSLGTHKNIESRLIDYSKIAGGIQHAKYFIVDKREVYFGSQNFDWRSLKHIHELGFRLRHADAAAFYESIFEADWMLAGGGAVSDLKWNASLFSHPERLIRAKKDTVTFFPTCSPISVCPDSAHWDEQAIVRLMDEAKKEVVMQFLSFSPVPYKKGETFALTEAIRRTAARGVSVRIIVADWQKETHAEKDLKALSEVPNVELKFSAIPEWQGGYISFARVEHCKYIVADAREFWLGTSNAERGYFHESRNLGVIVQNAKLAARLDAIFLKSWNGPYTEQIRMGTVYTKRKHDGD
ncbi:MAG TPA: phospholipase D-like domain-containing protein [Bacteroidota bacterium]|nr:phospholipase D-like domain-containing protein [Bacteroidota bacterium]